MALRSLSFLLLQAVLSAASESSDCSRKAPSTEGATLLQLGSQAQKTSDGEEKEDISQSPPQANSIAGLANRSFLRQVAAVLRSALPSQAYDQISLDVPYSDIWGEIETFPERRPQLFNAALATFKTWMADLVVQVSEGSSPERRRGSSWFDPRRSFTFAMFGLVYVGLIQWVLYVSALAALVPHAVVFGNEPLADKMLDVVGQEDLLLQICYDNFLINPAIYFPVFYLIKGALSSNLSKTQFTMAHGLARYRQNFWADNLTSCVVWVPVDVLVFSAPMYLRMPLDHAFSFLWTMLLSSRRGGSH